MRKILIFKYLSIAIYFFCLITYILFGFQTREVFSKYYYIWAMESNIPEITFTDTLRFYNYCLCLINGLFTLCLLTAILKDNILQYIFFIIHLINNFLILTVYLIIHRGIHLYNFDLIIKLIIIEAPYIYYMVLYKTYNKKQTKSILLIIFLVFIIAFSLFIVIHKNLEIWIINYIKNGV
jgi:hypothetical protein